MYGIAYIDIVVVDFKWQPDLNDFYFTFDVLEFIIITDV